MHDLRPYQVQAVESIFETWNRHQSALLVMATGLGKTTVFSEVIRRVQPERVLVLCHRKLLVYQAAKRIESFGVPVGIEMAEQYASTTLWNQTPVIVSTVQTQTAGSNGGRMNRFDAKEIGFLVIDECHRAASESFRRTIDYYKQNPNLKILGVTATPNRSDEKALGQVFDEVAFEYNIRQGIDDGWLVDLEQIFAVVEGLDYSHVHTTAGDLNGAELADVMEDEKVAQGVIDAAIQILGTKKMLGFTAGVKTAEMSADIFNRPDPVTGVCRAGVAEWICGKTPDHVRFESLRRFRTGETQAMFNDSVFGEGYDEPTIEAIVQARPTSSLLRYTQEIGRGLRPLPGTVDGLDTPEERKSAIAASEKVVAMVLDVVGNSGRHKIMSAIDVLGGDYDEEVLELAKERARRKGGRVRPQEEIEAAIKEVEERKQREAARKARLVGKATYRMVKVNPFSAFDIQPVRERGWHEGKKLSEKQRDILRKIGLNPDDYTYSQGSQLVGEQIRRWKNKLCSIRQAKILKARGYNTGDMTFKDANQLITAISQREGWRKK